MHSYFTIYKRDAQISWFLIKNQIAKIQAIFFNMILIIGCLTNDCDFQVL